MASFRDSAPESFTRTIYRGSDFVTESTYRPETASDHLADSVYRPGTSSDQVDTSDSVAETKVPTRLKGPLKSRIISQLCEAEDFSADILHIPDQPARLVLQLGTQDDHRHRDTSNDERQSRKIAVHNLPSAAENEEYLDIFFESKKGGGPVKKVTLMKDTHSAIIEFEHADAVKRVLDKVPIIMHHHSVDVEVVDTLLDDDEIIDSVQIKGLRGLAAEIRGLEVEDETVNANNEVQIPKQTVIIYSGIEAAKVWHFCAKELENIVTSYDALVTTEPISGTPNSVTISAEKKFENNIRKMLRAIQERLLSLQEAYFAVTDIRSYLADKVPNFNACNEHILLISDVERKRVLAIFDDACKPKSAMRMVQSLISDLEKTIHAPSATNQTPCELKGAKPITAALEIGDTYSWYGFSFRNEYLNDPTAMHTFIHSGGGQHCMHIPTIVLFDERKQFHSAGYDAESHYSEMECGDELLRWHFFKRFTNFLKSTQINSETCIKDDSGRRFPAKDVVAAIMRFLKQHLVNRLQRNEWEIQDNDIHWVLTVPAYWSDTAKQFMRESANVAGIKDEQLSLVLQSEAAALYSQLTYIDANPENLRGPRETTGKMMVVDLGNEISSLTVLEGQPNEDCTELFKTSSSTFCGSRVRNEFFEFLQQVLGHDTITEFKDSNQMEYLYLQHQLEDKFQNYKSEPDQKVAFKIPGEIVECLFTRTGKRMKEVINASSFKGRLTWIGDKLQCESGIVAAFFNNCCTELVDAVRKILENPELVDTGDIVLVGEFSRPPIIQEAVINAFPDRQVIIPSLSQEATLTGAVIYGHKLLGVPKIPKYTYGIAGPIPLQGVQQPQSETPIHIYFPRDQMVREGEVRSKPSYIKTDRCTKWEWKLFASKRKFLSTAGDDCKFLDTITLNFPADGKPVRVDFDMTFGYSRVTVKARDLKTGNSATAKAYI